MAILNRAMVSVEAALAIDPNYSLAWAMKARIHGWLIIFGPADQIDFEKEEGLSAALKAIKLEPNLTSAYVSLGWIKTSSGDFIGAESAYRKALRLTADPLSGSEIWIVSHYQAVGNFKRANELLEEIHQNDPLDKFARTIYMLNFALRGEFQKAEDEYERGMALFEQQWDWGDDFIANIRLLSGSPMTLGKIVKPPSIIWDAAKEYLESPEDGLEELHRIYNTDDNLTVADQVDIMLWAGYFGDNELALDAMEKSLRKHTQGAFWAWFPVFKQIRQTSRFKELVREIGLVDYWEQFGWPDLCHPLDNGDFVCD
jgi:tetratricopeptide (TPR) repeat protein